MPTEKGTHVSVQISIVFLYVQAMMTHCLGVLSTEKSETSQAFINNLYRVAELIIIIRGFIFFSLSFFVFFKKEE